MMLRKAGTQHRPALENLFQMYQNEIAEYHPPIKLDSNGRYPEQRLARCFENLLAPKSAVAHNESQPLG